MTQEQIQIIDKLIADQRPFALWRLPMKEKVHFILQTKGPIKTFTNLSDLNNTEGFVIAPYHTQNDNPIIVIQPDCTTIPKELDTINWDLKDNKKEEALSPKLSNTSRAIYNYCFDVFKQKIDLGEAQKIVLSRNLIMNLSSSFSTAKTFNKALSLYKNSYVYLFHTPYTGSWIGSSPEILLSKSSEDIWETVALAGTQRIKNKKEPIDWDCKNQKEQQFVVDYITEKLNFFGVENLKISKPFTSLTAGDLAHLKTTFNFSLQSTKKIGDLLKILHPTPATSGQPKELTKQLILKHEPHDRKYYTGFIGITSPSKETHLFVNLRCMQITKDYANLYAGGGLLPDSTQESEWKETEYKLETMKSILM